MCVNKYRFWALFAIFDILGPKKGRGPTGTPPPPPPPPPFFNECIQKSVDLTEVVGHDNKLTSLRSK